MSAQRPPYAAAGIPFPQSHDQAGSSPTEAMYGRRSAANSGSAEANRHPLRASSDGVFVMPFAPLSPRSRTFTTEEQQQQQQQQQQHHPHSSLQASTSTQSSSPTSIAVKRAGKSLPSIHNLLSSINTNSSGQEGEMVYADTSAPRMMASRASFRPPVRASSSSEHGTSHLHTSVARYQRTQAIEDATLREHRQSPSQQQQQQQQHHHHHHHHHHAGPSSGHSWDAKMYMRSISPSKRPPLAPSAYAHSQYTAAPTAPLLRSTNVADAAVPWAYPTSAVQRPTSSVRHSPSLSFSSASAGRPVESASLRMSGLRTGVQPAPLITSGAAGRAQENEGSGQQNGYRTKQSMPTKRAMHSQADLDEPPLSPASARRRHTVGSLEEPVGLLPRNVGLREYDLQPRFDDGRDADSTPRPFQQSRLASPSARPGLDSPTTPTAGHPSMVPRSLEDDPSHLYDRRTAAEIHRDGPSVVPHRIYMQQSAQASGSMPSLSSSVSTVSVGSERERGRVHSFEGRADGTTAHAPSKPLASVPPPPSAWHTSGNTQVVHPMSGGSETFTSPQSSVWHSRSSTLDSIESNSSMGSTPSGGSFQNPRRALSRSATAADFALHDGPVTPKHSRSDYNREWRFPHHRHDSDAPDQHREMMRTRHESLSAISSAVDRRPTGPPCEEAYGSGHMPPSPFANLSLASPPAHRPRAQTMTYNERRIAPLPTHGVYGQAMMLSLTSGAGVPQQGVEHGEGAALYAIPPQRSFSSQSLRSLPGRVSSMDIDSGAGRVGGGGGLTTYDFVPNQNPSSGTLIVNTHGALSSGVGSGGNGSGSTGGGGAGAAKYECGWCGKRFSRPSSLKIHHHSHTGEKPFTCSEPGCGRTFSVQSNLRRHQKSHIANARKLANDLMHGSSLSGGARVAPGLGTLSTHGYGEGGGGAQLKSEYSPSYGSSQTAFPVKGESFRSLRERKASVSSSTAGEGENEKEYSEECDEEEEEEYESGAEEEALAGPATQARTGKRLHVKQEDDMMMQDIHEEHPSNASTDERPATAGSVQARFQGLLNPPSSSVASR